MKRGAVQAKFTVETQLVALTSNEAGKIARSLVSILMANATAAAAVDEHIMTFPALGELDREYRWFRPMMEAIATELMDKVAYVRERRASAFLPSLTLNSLSYTQVRRESQSGHRRWCLLRRHGF
jgi:hypothetical protein